MLLSSDASIGASGRECGTVPSTLRKQTGLHVVAGPALASGNRRPSCPILYTSHVCKGGLNGSSPPPMIPFLLGVRIRASSAGRFLMSECEYYEFQAIDLPLSAESLRALRAISSRARGSASAARPVFASPLVCPSRRAVSDPFPCPSCPCLPCTTSSAHCPSILEFERVDTGQRRATPATLWPTRCCTAVAGGTAKGDLGRHLSIY
jgi:hypothetical protein